jgi:EAL domain-containing protein (putative c-di-GMP-specific phosphodiesterase class I)
VLSVTGCRPDMLALEITETALMEAGAQARDDLAELRSLGVSIGLDDFGTGYSSLGYIKRFPLDFLKIDRCFVAGLGQNPEDDAIVDAVISLARSLGLKAVAEGVESSAQMLRLSALGCDRMQGFLLGRPMPAAEMDDLLRRAAPAAAGRRCPPVPPLAAVSPVAPAPSAPPVPPAPSVPSAAEIRLT